jgi:hypothetical protein
VVGKRLEKFLYDRKNSNMVRKIPTWLEKFQLGQENSDMVGKNPTWLEKRWGGVHAGLFNQAMQTYIIC